MAKRKDGIQTREQVLATACEVFVEKGYHDTTVEEICKRAKSNIAAVNYYSGSEDQPHMKLDLPAGQLVETLTEHITRFSLAGIQAVRRNIDAEHT